MMRDDETSADASLRETRVVLARQRARTLRVVEIARHHQAESTRQLLLRTIETAKLNAATTRAEQAERDLAAMRGERDAARAMAVEVLPFVDRWRNTPHVLRSGWRALVESWRADAERKDGAR
jgi:hypothetical protein